MTEQEFLEKYHITLTSEQLFAMRSVDRPTLLLAVPGSGKTTTLIARLGYLIFCKGVMPEKIMTITYTVAATKEMQQRFADKFGEDVANRVAFRTINALCYQILIEAAYSYRRTLREMIDETERKRLLSNLYHSMCGDYAAENDIQSMTLAITYIKNMLLSDAEMDRVTDKMELPMPAKELFYAYDKEMKALGKMDFDDQLVGCYNLFRRDPAILEKYREMYQYICVDESQDTSKIQHMIIRLMAEGKNNNCFMVGDEDQSIYGFRAAYPQALLDFEKTYPNASVLYLSDNFRSNANIVEAADRMIQFNKMRHKKVMHPTKPAGSAVDMMEIASRKNQYEVLLSVAKNAKEETAILYRNNESAIPMVDLLDRENIPYQLASRDILFFTCKVTADLLQIFRFIAGGTMDASLLLQCYYKTNLFLKKQEAEQLAYFMENRGGVPAKAAVADMEHLPKNKQKNLFNKFSRMLQLKNARPADLLSEIYYEFGYEEYLGRIGTNGEEKFFILKEIAKHSGSAEEFLCRFSQLEGLCKKGGTKDADLILSTIHSAKGKEYQTVYLLDVFTGIFPAKDPMLVDDPAELEEERRLFYVGVTRAKENLHIFTMRRKSPFAREMMPVPVARRNEETAYEEKKRQFAEKEALVKTKRVVLKGGSPYQDVRAAVSNEDYAAKRRSLEDAKEFQHKKYGLIKIMGMEGDKIIAFIPELGSDKTFSLKVLLEKNLIQ